MPRIDKRFLPISMNDHDLPDILMLADREAQEVDPRRKPAPAVDSPSVTTSNDSASGFVDGDFRRMRSAAPGSRSRMSGAGSRRAPAARPSLSEDDRLELLGTITLTGKGGG